MNIRIIISVLALALTNLAASAQSTYSTVPIVPIDTKRVNEIATMLPDAPHGVGEPIEIRKHWNALYQTGKFKKWIAEADSINAIPFPKLTEEIYMSYFGGRDSETSKRFIMKRRMLLTKMIWAECLTNTGKYMPSIVKALNDIVTTPTWTFPAEDQKKTNYEGKIFTIGLSSSAYGCDMAQSLYLLNSKLPAKLKQQLYDAIQQRVFEPTLNAIKNKNANGEFPSLMDTGNHNSVTLAYVTMAALAVIKDKQQRAVFASIGERYSKNFLQGYLDDGYCTEGVAYYSYGFGHYVFLRDALWQATKGKIDLFKHPKVEKMAMFAPAMEIINDIYPAISDCEPNSKPLPQLMYYLNKNLGLGLTAYNDPPAYLEQPALCFLMYYFPNASTISAKTAKKEKTVKLRDYFDKAGVLTVRPAQGSTFNMGATFKGGNNAEHHNHNDVGSYTIVVGNELLTGDVGLATYTPKYFGKERYSLFKTTTSYGHNVPLIDGVQQIAAKTAQATILTTNFTPNTDVFAMDITSAYPNPNLKKLIRTFTYNRTTEGNIIVNDTFSLNEAGKFETALITRSPWKKINQHTLVINGKKEKLKITLSSSHGSFTISDEVIDEGPKPYTRIAIQLIDSAMSGSFTMKFEKL